MNECVNCKHYHYEWYDEWWVDEWCDIDNIYLFDDDCPNYEED